MKVLNYALGESLDNQQLFTLHNRTIWLLYNSRDLQKAAQKYCNRRLISAARELGIKGQLVNPKKVAISEASNPHFTNNGKTVSPPIAVIARSGAKLGNHGRALISKLSAIGVPVFPGINGYSYAYDKAITFEQLVKAGIPTPDTIILDEHTSAAELESKIGFPLVLKRTIGSKGKEVILVSRSLDFKQCKENLPGKGPIIAQKFIRKSYGKDIRILIVNGEFLGAVERQATNGDFRSNLEQGADFKPINIDRSAIELAKKTAKHFDVFTAGIDLLHSESGYLVCEVNIAPGFEAIEKATRKNIAGDIMSAVVDVALKKTSLI